MLKSLNTLMVYVQEMPRSVAFYRDTLGLPLRMESPGWTEFDLGHGVVMGLHRSMNEGKQPTPGWIPSFTVDDVRAAKERVVSSGARLTQDFHDIPGGVVIEFTDPDGNPISASQLGISCADLGVASAAN
jgi:predicted enzyme related to lactoylglutathione lyase